MPTVKRRLRPRFSWIQRKSWSSLPTWPSVTKMTWRTVAPRRRSRARASAPPASPSRPGPAARPPSAARDRPRGGPDDRARKEPRGRRVELDDVEAVAGRATSAPGRGQPGLLDGGPRHRAGGVDDVDHLAGEPRPPPPRPAAGASRARSARPRAPRSTPPPAARRRAGAPRPARSRGPPAPCPRAGRHVGAAADRGGDDRVERALQPAEREAGVQLDEGRPG